MNYILISITAALVLLGILVLSGVSAPLSFEKFGNTYYYLQHQVIFGLVPGFFLCVLAFLLPLSWFKKKSFYLLLGNLGLMAVVFLPKIGTALGGASRWVSLGPISFQPSEFLKLTVILYLATWFGSKDFIAGKSTSRRKSVISSFGLFAFLIVMAIVSLLLIFQPDIGTLSIIITVAAIMYFSMDTPFWHSILVFLIGTGSLFFLIKLAPYRFARFLVFLMPNLDPMGKGYQIKQAQIAIGSGGILGLGLGMSQQKFGFLPQSISDSIFAIFAEETGFLGSFVLILLFVMFFWQGLKIAKVSKDIFSKLTCIGITFWIVIQTFVNISAMVGLLPLTGIPLPFISYGGSHIIAELAGVGILLNISK